MHRIDWHFIESSGLALLLAILICPPKNPLKASIEARLPQWYSEHPLCSWNSVRLIRLFYPKHLILYCANNTVRREKIDEHQKSRAPLNVKSICQNVPSSPFCHPNWIVAISIYFLIFPLTWIYLSLLVSCCFRTENRKPAWQDVLLISIWFRSSEFHSISSSNLHTYGRFIDFNLRLPIANYWSVFVDKSAELAELCDFTELLWVL